MKKFLITFLLSINLLVLLINHVIASNEDFIQWKCYENSQSKAKLILTIGYFVSSEDKGNSVGFMTLETNKKIVPVMHKIKGIRDSFHWADEDGGLYSLIMSNSSGKSFFYDYNLLKIIKDPKMPPEETLICKNKERIKLDKTTLKNILDQTDPFDDNPVSKITPSEIEKIQKHISKCWKVNSASNYSGIVSLKISINKNMEVSTVYLVDKSKYINDTKYRAIADAAIRAVRDCSPLPIKKENLHLFSKFILDFNTAFLNN
jgi:hypothetical protein